MAPMRASANGIVASESDIVMLDLLSGFELFPAEKDNGTLHISSRDV